MEAQNGDNKWQRKNITKSNAFASDHINWSGLIKWFYNLI